MKTQMRFQKYLMLATLIVAALSFVYALSVCGGTIYEYQTLVTASGERVPGATFLRDLAQGYCDILIALSIVFIVLAVANYVSASHSRRNYYVTNYVTVTASAVYALVMAIIVIAFVSVTLSYFMLIDVEAARAAIQRYQTREMNYTLSNFILGYLLAAVCIINAVALGLNLLWKVKLMKGEKLLLQKAETAK